MRVLVFYLINFFQNEKKHFVNHNYESKSLDTLSKLPFVMLDPYIFLEDLKFVKDLIGQKKAFIVLPKLGMFICYN